MAAQQVYQVSAIKLHRDAQHGRRSAPQEGGCETSYSHLAVSWRRAPASTAARDSLAATWQMPPDRLRLQPDLHASSLVRPSCQPQGNAAMGAQPENRVPFFAGAVRAARCGYT